MKLLGFNFTKVSIEKFSDKFENLKVNSNIDISEINEVKQSMLKSKDSVLSVKFSYSLDYTPERAKIELKGNFLISLDPKLTKKILKEWESKKIPEEFKVPLFNLIIKKSNVKALSLEEDLNLPLHMPMPRVSKKGNQNKKSK
ncbi:MAG: hypothetical protein ACOC1P_02110 [Minisyncoccales bacterium]